jgi:hypothetical protein
MHLPRLRAEVRKDVRLFAERHAHRLPDGTLVVVTR